MVDRKQLAKQQSVTDVLLNMGYKPVNDTSTRAWYLSPFRSESEPSLVVNKRLNKWKDWGDKEKRGDVIELVMQMEGCEFKEAINYLLDDKHEFKKHNPKDIPIEETGIFIIDVEEIQNPYLIAYAQSRGIDVDLLRMYCQEVSFIFNKRPNIERKAIGFKNNKNGWELRYDGIKHSNSPKTWRTIFPDELYDEADVFEGFFDFLSHLTYMGWEKPKNVTFVLNSLVYSSFILDDLSEFKRVNLYLDNSAGAYRYIDDYFTGDRFKNMSQLMYPDFEDYNDFVKDQLLNK